MGKHVQEDNLKTVNGESLIGKGDINIPLPPRIWSIEGYFSAEIFPTNILQLQEFFLSKFSVDIREVKRGDLIISAHKHYQGDMAIDIIVVRDVIGSGIRSLDFFIRKLGDVENELWKINTPA